MPEVASSFADTRQVAKATPDVVLGHLADMVGTIADTAEAHASLLANVASDYKDYGHAARALLTGGDIPLSAAPGGSASIVAPTDSAMATLAALGDQLASTVAAVAGQGAALAETLDGVREKEIEEKTGRTPGSAGGGTTGTQERPRTPGSGGGPDPAQPGGGDTVDKGNPGSGKTEGGDPGKKPGDKAKQPDTPPVMPKISRPKNKREKHCYHFTLTNPTKKPVSDLHLTTPGIKLAPGGGPQGPAGWKASSDDGSVTWELGDGGKALAPGKTSGQFTLCLDGQSLSGDAEMSHPDGSRTHIDRDTIYVNGKPAPMGPDGKLKIPSQTSYLTDYTITIKDVTDAVGLSFKPGTVTGVSATGGSSASAALSGAGDGASLVPGGAHFRAGNEVTITVTSPKPDPAVALDPSRTR